MFEVRFHGRGGQGAVTAAELLAVAAGEEGKSSQSFPVFGVERRGAPVASFCRIDDKQIRIHQQVYNPDFVVVLDEGLLDGVDVASGLKENGVIIVNSKCDASALNEKLKPKGGMKVFVVDATGIALKNLGKPIVNTAMLGAFAKASGLVTLESVKKAVNERFEGKMAEKNAKAVEECFNELKQ